MSSGAPPIAVRNTRVEDFPGIIEMCREVYPGGISWKPEQLASHLKVFPEGQFVAVERDSGKLLGMAASLIVKWDDYAIDMSWRDFTDHGFFTNHDPEGRTLYAAEVMARPATRRRGVGSKLYEARWELVRRLKLKRIRAGARLRGYHRNADRMSAEEHTIRVIRGEIRDPTLSFQLNRGFHVLAVVSGYLRHDPESLGYAAIIERINPETARPEDYAGRDPRFMAPRK